MAPRDTVDRVGRQASLFFFVPGLAFLAEALLRPDLDVRWPLLLLAGANFLGAALWATIPWGRYPPQAQLCIVVPALLDIAAAGWVASVVGVDLVILDPSVWIIGGFVWVGISQPRGMGLVLAVPVFVVFGGSLHWNSGLPWPLALGRAGFTVFVGALLAEVEAWGAERSRTHRRLANRQAALLAVLARNASRLHESDADRVLSAVVSIAADLGFPYCAVVRPGGGEATTLPAVLAGPLGAGGEVARPPAVLVETVLGEGRAITARDPSRAWDGVGRRGVRHRWGASGLPVGSEDLVVELPAPFAIALAVPVVTEFEERAFVHASGVPGGPDGGATVAGVLVVASPEPRAVGDAELAALGLLAAGAGRALAVATTSRALETRAAALREAAHLDGLTGVGNRRAAALALAGLNPGDAVVMIDLDHFKRLNDTRGHLAGDEVLAGFAAFLQGAVRPADRVSRWGGEEFLVVLKVAENHAPAVVNRFRQAWARTDPAVTFSAGVCVFDGDGTPERAVARADEALYEAKRCGRDRVFVAGPDGPRPVDLPGDAPSEEPRSTLAGVSEPPGG